MVKNGCKNTIAELTKKLSKAIIIRNLFIVIGSIGLILGIGLPLILQSTQNPFENPQPFKLTNSFEDFYVMDNDTLERNYSYYIHNFEVNGLTLQQDQWDILKEMTFTEFSNYAENNTFYMERNIWGILGSSLNLNSSADNKTFVTYQLPIVIFFDFHVEIWNEDKTYWDNAYFSLIYPFSIVENGIFGDYPYTSIGFDEITLNFKGCNYNFTSGMFDKLYLDFNGSPIEAMEL